MKLARPAAAAPGLVALLAVFVLPGCRTGGLGPMAPSSPAPIAPQPRVTKAQVIDQINRNARQVETLKARKLSVDVNVADRERYSVDGQMALERPRNFKLELNSAMGKEADIGSNDKGFWFWTRPRRRGQPKEFYACDYDESGRCPLEGPLQPDWIVEALGLREVPEDEAATMVLQPDAAPNAKTLVLSRRIEGDSGTSYQKVLLVDRSSLLIREIRLFRVEADRNVLLARAEMSGHQKYPVSPGEAAGETGAVILPSHVKLAWFTPDRDAIDVPRKLEIDVKLVGTPEINTAIKPDLFEEFTQKGYTRVDLGEQLGIAKKGQTTVRETRPAPPSGVELGVPGPAEDEGDDSARSDVNPVALSAELPAIRPLAAEVVEPPTRKALEPQYAETRSSSWRGVATPAFER